MATKERMSLHDNDVPRGLAVYGNAIFIIVAIGAFLVMRRGRSHRGPLPPLTELQRALAGELKRDVAILCANGTRNTWAADAMSAAAGHIESSLAAAGHRVERQRFASGENLIVEI